MIKVSVLIPAYNAEDTIARAMDSVPDRDDIEMIVCNDCSTDMTEAEIVGALYEREANTGWYFSNERNKGVAYSVNRLMEKASGEYMVLLGADDWFTEKFRDAMDYLDGTDLVYFDLQINDGSIFHLAPYTKTLYCGSVKFMRREFVGDTRCPENKKASEDRYFYQELLAKNPTETFTRIVAKHYNFPREGSLSWRQRNGLFTDEEI